MIRLVTICIFFLIGLKATAQLELTHRRVSVENGLPSNTIFDIKQGEDGSIIIAHNAGLSRYNGIRFNNYQNNLKTTSLSNILEIYPQTYLCVNFNDEVFFTASNELIKIPSLSIKKTGYSTFFSIDNCVYSRKANTISKLTYQNGINEESVIKVDDDTRFYAVCVLDKTIYAIHGARVFCINTSKNNAVDTISIPHAAASHFLFAKDAKVHVYTPELKKVYVAIENELIDSIALSHIDEGNKVNLIQTLANGYVAVGTFAGLFLYDKNFQFLGHYFKDSQISCIHEDIESNLWIGTLQDGIYVVPSLGIKTIDSDKLFQEKSNLYSSLVVKDSLLIIGTYNGKIGKLNTSGELLDVIDLGQVAEIQAMFHNEETDELVVFCDKLFTLDFESLRVKKIEKALSVKSILQLKDETFCGTSTGLQIISSNGTQNFRNDLWIKSLTHYHDEVLLETASGLFSFDLSARKIDLFEPLASAFGPDVYLTNFMVAGDTLYFSEGSNLYFLTSNGLEKLVEIPKGSISSIERIGANFFISNRQEIYLYSNQKLGLINKYKGLEINEISALHQLDTKLLVVGNRKIQFFEQLLKKNRIKPMLSLTSVKGTFKKNAVYWESAYEQNQFKLEFEALPNISAKGTTKIAFELKGALNQSGEIDLQKDKSLLFERLPHGKYELNVNAINEDGVGSDTLTLKLVVLKPYYLNWWFFLILAIGMLLLIFLLVKWRIRILSKKNMEKMQQEQLKIKALNAELNAIRAQMNPHFIFNCLSSIQSKILDDDSQNAYSNLTVFTKLLREALLFTSKEFISLAEEISFIKKYVHLEQMRREGAFEFKLEVDESIQLNSIKFPSLFTQPLVENAILHGLMHQSGPNHLIFRVKPIPGNHQLTIEIEDNGIGIVQSQAKNRANRKNHVSFGVQAIKERVELLQKSNYSVTLKTIELTKGTKVIINIPIQNYGENFK